MSSPRRSSCWCVSQSQLSGSLFSKIQTRVLVEAARGLVPRELVVTSPLCKGRHELVSVGSDVNVAVNRWARGGEQDCGEESELDLVLRPDLDGVRRRLGGGFVGALRGQIEAPDTAGVEKLAGRRGQKLWGAGTIVVGGYCLQM
jgi:hypothetical protein